MRFDSTNYRVFASVFIVAVAMLLFHVPEAAAQAVTGTISGKVVDPDGASMPGVTVTIESDQLITQTRSAVTGSGGSYRFINLIPGKYVVVTALDGFATLRNEGLVVRAGVTSSVDVEMQLASLEEVVIVSGRAPLIDIKQSQTLETFSEELLANIPTSRVFVDIFHKVPGVEDGQYRQITPGASSINGGSSKDNQVNLEGSNISSSVLGYPNTDVAYDTIAEVQVVTAGITAEFGGGASGVVNVVTKSGGNRFSGSAYGHVVNGSFQASNISADLAALGVGRTQTLDKDHNYGVSFGGPVFRNKVWFFANYDRKDIEETRLSFPAPITAIQDNWYGKITGQVGADSTVKVFYQHRKRADLPFIPSSSLDDDKVYRAQDVINDLVSGTWSTGFGENTMVEVKGNYNRLKRFQDFPNAGDAAGYQDQNNGHRHGGWYRAVVHPGFRDSWQLKSDVSHFTDSHDVKAGVEHIRRWVDEIRVFKPNGIQQQLYAGDPYRVVIGNYPVTLRGNTGTTSFYLQDAWTVDNRLTINLGLRFERQSLWIPEGYTGGANQSFDKKIFPRDDLVDINTWSPRFGAVYALGAESRTALKATFGRYYSPIFPFQFTKIAKFASGALTYEWDDLNDDLVFQYGEEGSLIRDTTATSNFGMDPDLAAPYWDTLTVGIDHEFGAGVRFSATAIYRKEQDQIETIDASRPFDEAYNAVSVTNPLNGEAMTVYALDPAYTQIPAAFLVTNPGSDLCSFCPDPERNYKGLQFVIEKRMSNRWQLYGSYTLSSAKGNKGTHHRTWGSGIFSNPNKLINSYGATTLDRTHSMKLMGTWVAPREVLLSFSYTGQSGIPFQQDRGVMGPEVRISRSASPLIVVESRMDVLALAPGERRLSPRHLLDLRAEKRFEFSESGLVLGVILDVMNATNADYENFLEDVLTTDRDYGVPGDIVFPRTLRLGLRLSF
jgi:hypothetical protein